jgi:zinc protease
MKKKLSVVVMAAVVLVGFAASSCKSKTERLGIQLGSVELNVKDLSNGLKVILLEDHTVPIVSYQTWFRVGSVDEKPGITGISHLFEHLMFKGTPKYGPKQFFEQIEAKGAEVNAFTTRDYTVYYENFVPDLLDKVIEMEADRMSNLTLNEEVLNSERMVVLEERRLRTDNSPAGKLEEALWGMAYRYHPYQWPVIGYSQDLLSIKLPDVIQYYKDHYQPANAVLVVVGDFSSDRIFRQIKSQYGSIASRSRPVREIPQEPEQKEERRQIIRDEVASEEFAQAYRVTSASEEDSYALDVLANILFAGSNSRAHRKLVEERDVALGVSGVAFTPTFPGLFMINGTMKKGLSSEVAEKLLEQVIGEVQEKGVSEDEVKVAVRQLTVQLIDSVRTPYGFGVLLGTVQTVLGDSRRFDEDLSKYLKVTTQDVQRVARKYLIPNHRSVVTLAPKMVALKEVRK